MANHRVVEFRTPVVREMTHAEYREQRRRVIASLVRGQPSRRGIDRASRRSFGSPA
jgi:hypothetical protein